MDSQQRQEGIVESFVVSQDCRVGTLEKKELNWTVAGGLYGDGDGLRPVPDRDNKVRELYRSPWRRDYARLIHCPSFRRLQGKTQVFPGHESDFYRNRLTHSLEVAQIGKSIAMRLNATAPESQGEGLAIDPNIAEFAGLAHDLGHPPFGHNGEEALDECMYNDGGFEGNAQTLRIVGRLEKKVTVDGRGPFGVNGEDLRMGLNLTYRSLAGILKYDRCIPRRRRSRPKKYRDRPMKGYYAEERQLVAEIKRQVVGRDEVENFKTIECSIMDIADDIAYSTYDLEDNALRCLRRTDDLMIIAGGTYVERCHYPAWDRLFGSGLRAAMALQCVCTNLGLHTYAPSSYRGDLEATLSGAGIPATIFDGPPEMNFEWLHPFDLLIAPDPPQAPPAAIRVEADAVLRFGMIEQPAWVRAGKAVYDPQNEIQGFLANRSEASELVMVLSEKELARQALGENLQPKSRVAECIKRHFELSAGRGRCVVLLKDGLGGVKVFLGDEPTAVPTYAAESFFKIGSGDVLAAAFAYAWTERSLTIVEAADYAARAVAWFVDGARLPLPADDSELPSRRCGALPAKVRILGPSSLEMGQLLFRTEEWVDGYDVDVEFDFGDRGAPDLALPTLVLVGKNTSPHAIADLAERTQGAYRTVVHWPSGDKAPARDFFPGARVTDDYASALFHLLRGEST
jgi:hypothetical protein